MKKQKIILFDIDNTVFDKNNFKKMIYKKIEDALLEKGIKTTENDLKKIYADAIREAGYFNPELFIRIINAKFDIKLPSDYLEKNISTENLKKNLYSDTKIILDRLSINKETVLGIFSKGDDRFQRNKIESFKKLFHEDNIHIFVDKGKEIENILKRYDKHTVFIIDDLLEILSQAKKTKKDVITVWIKRENFVEYAKPIRGFKPDYEIKNLRDLPAIIDIN